MGVVAISLVWKCGNVKDKVCVKECVATTCQYNAWDGAWEYSRRGAKRRESTQHT